MKQIHVGDYVQFHKDKFGYVEQTLPNNLIRVVEDDGSLRPRCYHVRKNLVAAIPKNGDSPSQNRALRQPHVPSNNITLIDSDYETEVDSIELITVLKKTKYWTSNQNSKRNVRKIFFLII